MTTTPTPAQHTPTALVLLIVLLSGLWLSGCATTSKSSAQQPAAEDIYAQGREALEAEEYAIASSRFKSLEIYYPDSPYNHQAQMELAYAYFKSGDYSSAIATTDRLIRNFPNNDNLDYPRYLKALASFEQTVFAIEQGNDKDAAILSAQTTLQYFNELTTHFPNSKYQQDANKRVNYLQEQLAQYEVSLARSMIEQGNHASAVVHARNVVENYPQTRSAADALAIVDMGYEIMSIDNSSHGESLGMGENMADDMTVTMPDAIVSAVPMVTSSATDTPEDVADQETDDTEEETNAATDAPHLAGTHSTGWILQQPADHYTIQLISTVNDATLSRFISRNKLDEQVAYYRKTVNGRTWHALVYGVYASASEARAAIANLPAGISNNKPWALNLEAVHQAINDFANNP